MSKNSVQGEGNYEAAKQYDDATEKFVNSGKVDEAARKATPKDSREAEELLRAEQKGKEHSKGEDPLLKKGATPTPESADDKS
ncbi:MAG: hypothetical protein ABSF50_03060 [Burkholderiaceae bacterium]